MNILKHVFKNEVFKAMGCTEPISCAYASGIASSHLKGELCGLELSVDPGTYKNGSSVNVPHTNGQKGNLIAAILGALIKKPEAKLEILQYGSAEMIKKATLLKEGSSFIINCDDNKRDFYIKATARSSSNVSTVILEEGHTTIKEIIVDGETILSNKDKLASDSSNYRDDLKDYNIEQLVEISRDIDEDDRIFIEKGIEINLKLADCVGDLRGAAYQLRHINKLGHLKDDMFFRVKMKTSAAVDARMAGISAPAMTSGGSGNQGILAILTPYLVGKEMNTPQKKITESIALAHLLNAYTKCFLGELSVICGCAMSAGLASAAAIVYQKCDNDIEKISYSINNVVGDLGGLICDGAKPGCALKAITSVDSAIRSALMAIEGESVALEDGILGNTPEESIQNLGQVCIDGMYRVDHTVLKILKKRKSQNS